MKILLLGANGFIGSHLLTLLEASSLHVRIVTRKHDRTYNPRFDIFHGDLTDIDFPYAQLISDCDVILNCAGEIRDEALMQRLHVDVTNRLLAAARAKVQAGGSIHWVQLSSVGAYGPGGSAERHVTESTAPHPVGTYEVTKTIADDLIVEACDLPGLTYSILRPSNVFGEKMSNNSLRQLAAFVKRRLFFYIGFHQSIATYVHVDDVAAALMLCVTEPRAQGQIFNLSNDCLLSDLIGALAKHYSVSAPKLRVPISIVRLGVAVGSRLVSLPVTQERIDALTARTRYSTEKIESVLGFRPSKPVVSYIHEVL